MWYFLRSDVTGKWKKKYAFRKTGKKHDKATDKLEDPCIDGGMTLRWILKE